MHLTKEEEKILDGEHGVILERSLRLLTKIGDFENADKLIPISKSQIAGVSFKTAGKPTLDLVEHIAEEKVRVKTLATLNPAGMPLDTWKELGIPEDFAENQLRLCKAYGKLGIKPWCTCVPYLPQVGNIPEKGEIVGFSESSAVVYVNSVLGARTNRHGGLDALASAFIGKIPNHGYIKKENRRGTVLVKVKCELKGTTDYSALGYFLGKEIGKGEIPVYEGIKPSQTELRHLGAGSAASGSVALFHVLGVTPEALSFEDAFGNRSFSDKIEVTRDDIDTIFQEYSLSETPDLVAMGCPHCSIDEIKNIAEMLRGKKIIKDTRFWVCTADQIKKEAERLGYSKIIKKAGGKIIPHTCVVVAPIEEMEIQNVIVNSAKAAFYVPRMTKGQVNCGLLSVKDCIQQITNK